MDGPDPATITVRPTNAFAEMQGPVLLRAWRGVVDGDGDSVVALVASVRTDVGNEELSHPTPVEPPDMTDLATAAMGRLCRVVSRLQPSEVDAIAALAELVTGYADTVRHRQQSRSFCQDVLKIVGEGTRGGCYW